MLSLPPSVRIFLSREPADMRKGFDTLAQLVREHLGSDLPRQNESPIEWAKLTRGIPRECRR